MTKLEVIDFYAEWCGPCKAMAPALESLKSEYPEGNDNGVVITKLNVDEQPEVAQKYSVRNIPTLVYLKDGVEVHRTAGMQTKAAMDTKIKEILAEA
jgi:thioredoxin 1